MSDENDICGAECADGTPCEHPAGSCPVASHADPDAENQQGRPTEFTDERAREAITAARDGKSKAGCERAAGIGDGTIDSWLELNPTFEDRDGNERRFFPAFRRARGQGEDGWIDEGRGDDGDSSFAKFMLASSYDYQKSEKREHEHSGDGGGPIEVAINETVVETDYDGGDA